MPCKICRKHGICHKCEKKSNPSRLVKPQSNSTEISKRRVPKKNYDFWPNYWAALHTLTFIYPENPNGKEKKRMKNFFEGLRFHLICPACQSNYSLDIRENPISKHLGSRQDLVKWLVNIHNITNSHSDHSNVYFSSEKVIKFYTEKDYETYFKRYFNIDLRDYFNSNKLSRLGETLNRELN